MGVVRKLMSKLFSCVVIASVAKQPREQSSFSGLLRYARNDAVLRRPFFHNLFRANDGHGTASRKVIFKILATLFLASIASTANAQQLDAVQLLRNLSNQLGPWFYAVVGAAYLIGWTLFFKALYHLKVYGELRTMMSRETSLKTPLTWMAIGAAFIFFPYTLDLVMQSTFNDPRILLYSDWQGATTGNLALAEQSIFNIVRFVGLVAFVRGMLIVSKAAQQGTQQRMGKGFTHIIAGILGMNIVATANMLAATFGISY